VDPETGILIWERLFGSFVQQMLIDNDVLYITFSGNQESIVAVDIESSKTIWSVNRDDLGDEGLKTITIAGDRLYAGGRRLFAFSGTDGSVIWSSDETGLLESPLVFDSFVFARNRDKELFQFDAMTGEKIGKLTVKLNSPMKYDPERSPIVYEDLLIVPFGDDRVFAYLLK
jgi:outer membrane protein assembly factor BamB